MNRWWGRAALVLTVATGATGAALAFPCPDLDDDGYAVCVGCTPTHGNACGDCDDLRRSVHPNAPESCSNDLDDDCDGSTDAADRDCSVACTGDGNADSDRDAVPDCRDNCVETANFFQQDFDGDGQGDACETGQRLADIDRSGRVDGLDLALLGRSFGLRCQDAGFDRGADLTRDCRVDGDDLAMLAALFGRS